MLYTKLISHLPHISYFLQLLDIVFSEVTTTVVIDPILSWRVIDFKLI